MPTPGCIWIEGDNFCYINANENKVSITPEGTEGVTAGSKGFWLNGDTVYWINEAGDTKCYAQGSFEGEKDGKKAGCIWVDTGRTHFCFTDETDDEVRDVQSLCLLGMTEQTVDGTFSRVNIYSLS